MRPAIRPISDTAASRRQNAFGRRDAIALMSAVDGVWSSLVCHSRTPSMRTSKVQGSDHVRSMSHCRAAASAGPK
jgi:hypothetical protein